MKNLLIILLLFTNTIAKSINPSRVYERTPKNFGLKYEQHKIRTPDGFDINAWEYATIDQKAERIVIFVGPDAGNMSHMIWQAKHFLDKGFRVISFDYRGFGESSDFDIKRDFLFHSEFVIDLDSVIRFARSKYLGAEVGLYGLSMGSFISLLSQQEISFIIAEGFYNDPAKVINRIRMLKGKDILLPDSGSVTPTKALNARILIFAASNDQITTESDAISFAQGKDNVKVHIFNGDHLTGFHTLSINSPGDKYLKEIADFLR